MSALFAISVYSCVGLKSTRSSWLLCLKPQQTDLLNAAWGTGGLYPRLQAGGKSELEVALDQVQLTLDLEAFDIGTVFDLARPWDPEEFDMSALTFHEASRQFDIWVQAREIALWIERQLSSFPTNPTSVAYWRAWAADTVTRNL